MSNRENEKIVKTYTCELPNKGGCSQVYHAMFKSEFDVYNNLSKLERDKFDKKILDQHIKNCYRKQDYAGK